MWDAIVNELEVKMEQGVDVRVIYDDLGSISLMVMCLVTTIRPLTMKLPVISSLLTCFLKARITHGFLHRILCLAMT